MSERVCYQHKKSRSIHCGDPTLASVKNIIKCQQDAGLCTNNAGSVKYVYHWGKEKKKKYLFLCATYRASLL